MISWEEAVSRYDNDGYVDLIHPAAYAILAQSSAVADAMAHRHGFLRDHSVMSTVVCMAANKSYFNAITPIIVLVKVAAS